MTDRCRYLYKQRQKRSGYCLMIGGYNEEKPTVVGREVKVNITAKEIAGFAKVSVGKVEKDISRGKLDKERLKGVMSYCFGKRLLVGGWEVLEGIAESCRSSHDEEFANDGSPATSVAVSEEWSQQQRFSEWEEDVMLELYKFGQSRKEAEKTIMAGRAEVGSDRLSEADAEALGW